MSHFTKLRVRISAKNEKEFVSALEKHFGVGTVEVHEEGAPLIGYEGRSRSELSVKDANYAPECNLIVRRKDVGLGANDVGYLRTDGGYEAYISEFDRRINFNKEKQDSVLREFSEMVATKTLVSEGYLVKRQQLADGSVQLKATRL